MYIFIPGTENHSNNTQSLWLSFPWFGKWGATIKPRTTVLHMNTLKKRQKLRKDITDPDQSLNVVKMFKVKQEKECLPPAEKWVWEVIRSIFWSLKEPLCSSKQLQVKRARWGSGWQWLTSIRSCPSCVSLNNGCLDAVVYTELPGTTSWSGQRDRPCFAGMPPPQAQPGGPGHCPPALPFAGGGRAQQRHLPPLPGSAALPRPRRARPTQQRDNAEGMEKHTAHASSALQKKHQKNQQPNHKSETITYFMPAWGFSLGFCGLRLFPPQYWF